ncbi:hypothetical protein IJV57_01385 [Candidatus Saccharibacteria bacterium]|nr:hypothetical protein [Candidatus Saccharibacteria bacterium]
MHKQDNKTANNILASNKPTLTKYQARRILGKELSSSVDDAYLMRTVSDISSLVESICEAKIVPQIRKDC